MSLSVDIVDFCRYPAFGWATRMHGHGDYLFFVEEGVNPWSDIEEALREALYEL